LLRREGWVRNRKRTYRLYTALGLQVRTKRRRKIARPRVSITMPFGPNERWSLDFMSDQLSNGRRFRILNLVDDYSRECVGQIVDFSISGERLARFMDELNRSRQLPKVLVCDNGSEFTSKAMFFWSQRTATKLHFIQPGKPTQNAFVESFNGTFRDGCLNQHWFTDLLDARRVINDWRRHYNDERPHSALSYLPPTSYARHFA
jgi:putative transposase